MNLQALIDNGLQLAQHFLQAAHIDEHSLLLMAVGMIGGFLVGGGHHRRAYGAIRRYGSRYRPW